MNFTDSAFHHDKYSLVYAGIHSEENFGFKPGTLRCENLVLNHPAESAPHLRNLRIGSPESSSG